MRAPVPRGLPRAIRLAAVLVAIVVACLLGGRAVAQAIGDPVETFLDATGAVPTEEEGTVRIGAAEVRAVPTGNVLERVELEVALDAAGVRDAARTLAIASGYGAGIEAPIASFLESRAPDLAGNDPVTVALEEYLFHVEVRGDAPYEATLALELPRVPEGSFGPPVASLGPEDADVVVREFSDFQCPYCARYAREILPGLKASLLESGNVRFEFHHLPLDSIHANATPAAEAAQCVADLYGNEAFWAYHDLLFERQAAWQGLGDVRPYLARLAGDLPEDVMPDEASAAPATVAACQETDAVARTVDEATARARALRLSGTPSVFVGSYRLQNFGDPAGYARLIRLERAAGGGGD